VLPKLIQEEKERQKQVTTIDFSFKIGLDEPVNNAETNEPMVEEEPYLSIIVDNNNNGLKRVCNIFDQYQLVCTCTDRRSVLKKATNVESFLSRRSREYLARSMVLWSDILHVSLEAIGEDSQFISDETVATTVETVRYFLAIEWAEETADIQ
jgi:hypothetical protein